MDLKAKLVLILFIVIVLAAIVIFFIHLYNSRPKWVKIYDFLRNCMWQYFDDNEQDYNEIINIKYYLSSEFDISLEQASLCIENWRNIKILRST